MWGSREDEDDETVVFVRASTELAAEERAEERGVSEGEKEQGA